MKNKQDCVVIVAKVLTRKRIILRKYSNP